MTLRAWRQRARELRRDTYAIYLARREPRVSWHARVLAGAVVADALRRSDLIPTSSLEY